MKEWTVPVAGGPKFVFGDAEARVFGEWEKKKVDKVGQVGWMAQADGTESKSQCRHRLGWASYRG